MCHAGLELHNDDGGGGGTRAKLRRGRRFGQKQVPRLLAVAAEMVLNSQAILFAWLTHATAELVVNPSAARTWRVTGGGGARLHGCRQ